MPSIVQFFHPGQEHGYDYFDEKDGSYIKDWHTTINEKGKEIYHMRKFILNEGSYIKNDQKYDGKLLFWGEWEPPSRVEKLKLQGNCSHYGVNPEYIHFPFLPPDDQIKLYQDKHIYQNTDPFVFGEKFLYAICRQGNKKSEKKLNKINHLRELEIGSLIIFGSRVNFRFVIDTVFVVKEIHKYKFLEDIKQQNLVTHQKMAIDFILDKNGKLDILPEGRTLYIGATFDNPENGIYSFVPAKVYDGKKIGFPRFFMPDDFYKTKFKNYFQNSQERDNKIYEGGMMGIKNTETNTKEIYGFWNYLKNEISKDHVLGYNFKIPEVNENYMYRNGDDTFLSSVKRKPGYNFKNCY